MGLTLALALAACTRAAYEPRLHPPTAPPHAQSREPLKAHLRFGDVLVLDTWVETDSALEGHGARYNARRLPTGAAQHHSLPFDSIALLEMHVAHRQPDDRRDRSRRLERDVRYRHGRLRGRPQVLLRLSAAEARGRAGASGLACAPDDRGKEMARTEVGLGRRCVPVLGRVGLIALMCTARPLDARGRLLGGLPPRSGSQKVQQAPRASSRSRFWSRLDHFPPFTLKPCLPSTRARRRRRFRLCAVGWQAERSTSSLGRRDPHRLHRRRHRCD